MRCLYRHATGCLPEGECEHGREALERFYGPGWATCAAPTGWLRAGCKKDVPKDAGAVGHYRDTYVWVTADGRPELTRLTFAVLDAATMLFVRPGPPSKEVTTFEYRGDLLVWQEKRIVVDPAPGTGTRVLDEKEMKGLRSLKPEDLPPAERPVERLNYFDPYRGLFFTPR